MEKQFQFIANLAKQYHSYLTKPETLFHALGELEDSDLSEILVEYDNSGGNFQPVNFLRWDIARRLQRGEEVSETLLEEIKENIRTQNLSYFQGAPVEAIEQLASFEQKKYDVFSMWRKPWSIFYPFFYRGKIKQTTQVYLEQLSKQLIIDLELPDYGFHTVDFVGMRNTGSDYCWLSLFPKEKGSHKDGHQFFISFANEPEAGRGIGSALGKWEPDLEPVGSYEDCLSVFRSKRDEILELNGKIRNYFKYDPGKGAREQRLLESEDLIVAEYAEFNLGDISTVNSLVEMNEAMGNASDDGSYHGSWNLWLLKSASPGDVVFATRGVNKCRGICIVDGKYEFNQELGLHTRKVKWITKKNYDYEPSDLSSMKALFRPDFFAPSNVSQFIFSEYVRLYPELEEVFNEYSVDSSAPEILEAPETEETVVEEVETAFWWLNANPRMWKVGDLEIGETQTYTTRNEKGNKRRIYKYFEAAKEGDLVIGYESSPNKRVNSILEVSRGLHSSEE